MRDLTIRLAALDASAADAMRVITYFDELVEHGGGLSAIVRGAAVLSGHPAGLDDPDRRLRIRVTPDGTSRHIGPDAPVDPSWVSTPPESGPPSLWIEVAGGAADLNELILERARLAVEGLDRARPRGHDVADRHWASIAVDPLMSPEERTAACGRLGFQPHGTACAVAMPATEPVVVGTSEQARRGVQGRAGIGPAVPVLDLPRSWEDAQLALRLAADGTPADPGSRVVLAAEAGGLLTLARTVSAATPLSGDVTALDQVATTAPTLLTTLHAVAAAGSLRDAAASLHLHHSSVQERVARAQRLLGWDVSSVHGRMRLQLAFVLRRLQRPVESTPYDSP